MKLIKTDRYRTGRSLKEGPSGAYQQRFSVAFDYPVCFTRDLFNPANPQLAAAINRLEDGRRHRIKAYIDEGVFRSGPGIVAKAAAYFETCSPQIELVGDVEIMPGGEAAKNGWETANRMMASIASGRLCRQSFVLAIGGGSFLDVAGFAASLIHRGVRLIRVPTTVLAQNDAGIGVKNGIDDRGMKNFAGTFAPPFAVINDLDFLRSLPDKYWFGGISEAFKVAIIKDRAFFDLLCRYAGRLRRRDDDAIETVIKRCAAIHLEHIRDSGDPFEYGTARPLDFGHWSAHKLEILSGYEIGHGQAVSMGIALDAAYASFVGLITVSERDGIVDALEQTGLPVWSHYLEQKTAADELAILKGLAEFQEHLGGELHITLPNGIGSKVEVHKMDPDLIAQAVTYLKQRASASQ